MRKKSEINNEERLKNLNNALLKLKGLGIIKRDKDIVDKVNFHKSTISSILNGRYNVSDDFVAKFCDAFPEIRKGDIITDTFADGRNKNLIPFYDDAITVGGVNEQDADTQSITTPSEYIDTGDWFKEATAAIRHYGDSMIEYPPGCILALKEVKERQLVIWGRDYVIETSEYRITKRVQRGKSDESITAYSSNTETYPDGRLVHEPVDIAWSDIIRISLVLGYVVKKGSGTMVFSNPK
jgi:hypothetical protein